MTDPTTIGAFDAPTTAHWADLLLEPGDCAPAGLRSWNGSDPAQRFAVHRNNVLASLGDALAETFPVLREVVGADCFGALALAFVRQHPPRHPVLADWGEDFGPWLDHLVTRSSDLAALPGWATWHGWSSCASAAATRPMPVPCRPRPWPGGWPSRPDCPTGAPAGTRPRRCGAPAGPSCPSGRRTSGRTRPSPSRWLAWTSTARRPPCCCAALRTRCCCGRCPPAPPRSVPRWRAVLPLAKPSG